MMNDTAIPIIPNEIAELWQPEVPPSGRPCGESAWYTATRDYRLFFSGLFVQKLTAGKMLRCPMPFDLHHAVQQSARIAILAIELQEVV
jgi:hypothetical protein